MLKCVLLVRIKIYIYIYYVVTDIIILILLVILYFVCSYIYFSLCLYIYIYIYIMLYTFGHKLWYGFIVLRYVITLCFSFCNDYAPVVYVILLGGHMLPT